MNRIIRASEDDLAQHVARLEVIAKSAGAPSLWQQLGDRLCLENMDNRKTTGRTLT